jgi:hypothetical protein
MTVLRVDTIAASGQTSENTGSVFFDGDGDYLSLASSTDFALGTDNWTVEWFAYPTSTTQYQRHFYLEGASSSNIDGVFADSSGISFGRTGVWGSSTASNPLNQWNHYALVHDSTNMRLYINGVQVITDSNNFGTDATKSLNIGYSNSTFGGYFTGNISNFRILKGTALYTSNFAVPTRELEVTPETVLVCCHDGENIFAEKTGKIIAAYGDRTSSPTPTATDSPIGITTNYPPVTRGVDVTAGPTLDGDLKFNSQNFFVLPKGTTTERFVDVASNAVDAASARGLFGGGYVGPPTNIIDYITISSTGDATDFGDLTQARLRLQSCSSNTRGVFGGGDTLPSTNYNIIDYVTIASTGNAQDFGDLFQTRKGAASCSNSTRGLFAAGDTPTQVNTIDFVTIASTGNAQDFGDLTRVTLQPAACSSPTRGVFAGGNPETNTIDFVTIQTQGNALDFGDLTEAKLGVASCSSNTRGIFGGGYNAPLDKNVIDYITISTTSNATDFGDLTVSRYGASGCSSSTRGIIGGGYDAPAQTNIIDYVTIASIGDAQDFGDLTATRSSAGACSNGHGGLG